MLRPLGLFPFFVHSSFQVTKHIHLPWCQLITTSPLHLGLALSPHHCLSAIGQRAKLKENKSKVVSILKGFYGKRSQLALTFQQAGLGNAGRSTGPQAHDPGSGKQRMLLIQLWCLDILVSLKITTKSTLSHTTLCEINASYRCGTKMPCFKIHFR